MVRRPWARIVRLLSGAIVLSRIALAGAPPVGAVAAFDAHIRATEARLEALLKNRESFLWADTAERRTKLRTGGVICDPRFGKGDLGTPGGLIHHWVGAVFIRGVAVSRVLELVQDYDNHRNAYKPEVIASRILDRRGNDFRVRLRLLHRELSVTVVLDTEHEVRYKPLDGGDFSSRSYSTRIVEIANAGLPQEREKSPREDRGFLWRLYSYWLFRERDGGTYVECEAVSLSRDIPAPAKLMAPIVRSIIRGLPKGFLTNMLGATRDLALAGADPGGR